MRLRQGLNIAAHLMSEKHKSKFYHMLSFILSYHAYVILDVLGYIREVRTSGHTSSNTSYINYIVNNEIVLVICSQSAISRPKYVWSDKVNTLRTR